MPWLTRGRHIGHLARALDRLGLTDDDWTTQDLLDALERHNRARGRDALPAGLQRSPIGWLVDQLRQALAPVLAGDAETPGARRRRQASDRAADRLLSAGNMPAPATPEQRSEHVARIREQLRQTRRRPTTGLPLVEARPRAW